MREDGRRDEVVSVPVDPLAILALILVVDGRERIIAEHVLERAVPAILSGSRNHQWPFPAIEVFSGNKAAQQVLTEAASTDDDCEAQFLIGLWQLLSGNHDMALSEFSAAKETCRSDPLARLNAVAELEKLNTSGRTSPVP